MIPPKRLDGEGERRWVKRLIEMLRSRHAMWQENKLAAWVREETIGYFRMFDETPAYQVELDQGDRRFLKDFAAALGYRFATM